MKSMPQASGPFEMKLASDVALELIDKTNVETQYDKAGKLSHLVARVPPAEFFRLYTNSTSASVFIHGHWLQFLSANGEKYILDRQSHLRLRIDLANDEYSVPELRLCRKGSVLLRKKFGALTLEELQSGPMGRQALAKTAIKVFENLRGVNVINAMGLRDLPCVHVVPEEDDSSGFYAGFVNLQ